MLAEEHLRAHSYVGTDATLAYSHREIVDLMGNAFAGPSVVVSCLSHLGRLISGEMRHAWMHSMQARSHSISKRVDFLLFQHPGMWVANRVASHHH